MSLAIVPSQTTSPRNYTEGDPNGDFQSKNWSAIHATAQRAALAAESSFFATHDRTPAWPDLDDLTPAEQIVERARLEAIA